MAVELDDNGNPINPEVKGDQPKLDAEGKPLSGGDGQGAEGGGGLSFSKNQMEQLATLVGRISKKQIDESVLPLISRQTVTDRSSSGDALKQFNETLQQKIFEGDVMSALQMANDVQTRAKTNLSEQQKMTTLRELTNYADKPFYKEIYGDMKKFAEEVVNQGYPPQAAADYGYYKAKAAYLEGKIGGGQEDGGNLGFVEGGRPSPRRERINPLPPQFKAAMERDIRDGIFKDETEYRKSLHPAVRKQFGI